MDKVFVITGGTGGMGRAIASRMGKQGKLLLVDVNEDRLAQTKGDLAAQGITEVTTRTVDISNEQQINELAASAAELLVYKELCLIVLEYNGNQPLHTAAFFMSLTI